MSNRSSVSPVFPAVQWVYGAAKPPIPAVLALAGKFFLGFGVLVVLLLILYIAYKMARSMKSAPAAQPPPPPQPEEAPPAAEVELQRRLAVSPSVRARLPRVAHHSAAAEDGGDDADQCPFCLDEFTDGEVVISLPSCGHKMHIPCSETLMDGFRVCPLCRRTIEIPDTGTATTGAGGGGGGDAGAGAGGSN
ncbi:hypothetical protein Tsubulata_045392 [Turnera subulata]|uniref:RING-type domain-containing protein n=1 Tax=Turnera subulata TaxID=218843 RepID=A0A9Q0FJH0_9ROSI|nr:hypothetical protein Tsubulata_045392 [Turnera subulata]